MHCTDTRQRFLFEDTHIRGEITTLSSSFQAIKSRQNYPALVNIILGEFLAAASLLSATLKFTGIVSIQAMGHGAIKTIMAECSNKTRLRGIVRGDLEAVTDQDDFYSLLAGATLAITIEPDNGERYQGIVPIESANLSGCLEYYFEQSEQLSTKIKLTANAFSAAGIMIQQMPHSSNDQKAYNDWQHLCLLLDSLKAEEQLELDHETQLYRLFHEQQVRLFDPEALQFFCSCSKPRTAKTLVSLGFEEVDQIYQEQGPIQVTCEFCDQQYIFDKSDIYKLFERKDS